MREVDQGSLLCPSSRETGDEALVFGVAEGTAHEPRVTYLRKPLPLVEVRSLIGGLEPGEVFRTAAPCAQSGCAHFAEGCCSLVTRIVEQLDPVTTDAPRCSVRRQCRWWAEHGVEACRRCPRVVTIDYAADERTAVAATPDASRRPPHVGMAG
jgi:hypothetical protein